MPPEHAPKPLEAGSRKNCKIWFQEPEVGMIPPLVVGDVAQIKVTSTFSCNKKLTCRQMENKVRGLKNCLLTLEKPREHRNLEFYSFHQGWFYLWFIGHHTVLLPVTCQSEVQSAGKGKAWGCVETTAVDPAARTSLQLYRHANSPRGRTPSEDRRWPWSWMLPLINAGHRPWSQGGNAWQLPGRAFLCVFARPNSTGAGSSVQMLPFET